MSIIGLVCRRFPESFAHAKQWIPGHFSLLLRGLGMRLRCYEVKIEENKEAVSCQTCPGFRLPVTASLFIFLYFCHLNSFNSSVRQDALTINIDLFSALTFQYEQASQQLIGRAREHLFNFHTIAAIMQCSLTTNMTYTTITSFLSISLGECSGG